MISLRSPMNRFAKNSPAAVTELRITVFSSFSVWLFLYISGTSFMSDAAYSPIPSTFSSSSSGAPNTPSRFPNLSMSAWAVSFVSRRGMA
jgi:hypothetical protein